MIIPMCHVQMNIYNWLVNNATCFFFQKKKSLLGPFGTNSCDHNVHKEGYAVPDFDSLRNNWV